MESRNNRNNRTNQGIKWVVTATDFIILNLLLFVFVVECGAVEGWDIGNKRSFFAIMNIALWLSEWKFHTLIHERIISAGETLRRLTGMVLMQALIAYIILRHTMYWHGTGMILLLFALEFFVALLISRLVQRQLINHFRFKGRNSRTVTLVGTDHELIQVYRRLLSDPTTGYRILGYYGDETIPDSPIPHLGTIGQLVSDIEEGNDVQLGDEVDVSLSRRDGHTIRQIARLCTKEVSRFYFVPVSVETIKLNLKREYLNDIEIYALYESPLDNPLNRYIKRATDIVIASVALLFVLCLLPFIYIILKCQSPGPLFFQQPRTGLNGKDFMCYKFRSMHVNKDADKLQATKNDPRKFPFGNLMRKTNIDEMPQFWNVLKGDMSVVGPRPHMLAHTMMYSALIDKYMVRHLLKPGITGWAQVTGYRGETKELWQMEKRVERDIWYMENWSFWLDMRIIWMTFKSIFVPDKNAY